MWSWCSPCSTRVEIQQSGSDEAVNPYEAPACQGGEHSLDGETLRLAKKTDYLIVGDAPGSKLDEAWRLDVTLLDEPRFLPMVKPALD